MDDTTIYIYTDGSCLPHPRRGGQGIRIIYPDCLGMNEKIQDIKSDSCLSATNNAMELSAVINALKYVERECNINSITRIIIYTDSRYVSDNYRKAFTWWPNAKWYLSNGEPVLNADLWKELVKICRKIKKRIDINWVKGHSKSEDNKAVDKLAKMAAKSSIKSKFINVEVRRKTTPLNIEYDGISLSGKRLSIRIITSEYLSVQKICKYKYEIISKGHELFGCKGTIYSEFNIKAGHKYYVCFESGTGIAKISRIIREIAKKQLTSLKSE